MAMKTNNKKEDKTTAPLGATPEERVENGTESADDLAELANKTEAGEYTPSAETEQEMKNEGLLPNNDPQPNTEIAPAEPAPEQPVDNQPAVNPNEPKDPTPSGLNVGGNLPDMEQPMTQEEYLAAIDQVNKNENLAKKNQASGIIGAYQEGLIDKDQRDYFLMDSIMKSVNNAAKVRDEYGRRNRWDYKGDAKTPELDTNTAWTDFLKTDWTEAQKRKNEAKSKVTAESAAQTMELAKNHGVNMYKSTVEPEVLKTFDKNFKTPEEKVAYMATKNLFDGKQTFDADNMNLISDTVQKLWNNQTKDTEAAKQSVLKTMNDEFKNTEEKAKADRANRLEEAKTAYEEGKLTTQQYEQVKQRLDNQAKYTENIVANYNAVQDIEQKEFETLKQKYGDLKIKFEVGKFAGLELDGATIISMIKDSGAAMGTMLGELADTLPFGMGDKLKSLLNGMQEIGKKHNEKKKGFKESMTSKNTNDNIMYGQEEYDWTAPRLNYHFAGEGK